MYRLTQPMNLPARPGRPAGFRCLLAALALLLLSACGQLPPAPALPDTQWLRVQISPALALPGELLSACTPAGTGLAIQEASGTAFSADQTDLTLRWGAPAELPGYAAQIGEEELVLVVHPDNPLESLSLSALQTTYAGALPAWDWDYLGQAPLDLTIYAYPDGSDIQDILAAQLLSAADALPREAVVVPGPAELRDALAADPGGLGFLPRGWVDSRVKVVPVTGLPSGAWTAPILALSAVEPQGPARDWLLCVQQGIP